MVIVTTSSRMQNPLEYDIIFIIGAEREVLTSCLASFALGVNHKELQNLECVHSRDGDPRWCF